jgi:hypothetical protein
VTDRHTGSLRFKAIAALLGVLFSVAVVEVVFWRLPEQEALTSSQGYGYLLADAALGVRHVVSRTFHAELRWKSGALIYQADYSYDAFGRRVTVNDGSAGRHAALFFGCSYVDGTGVNDNETIPSQVALRASRYQGFNYGIGSSGPQQMLLQLRRRDFLKEAVPREQAVGVYVFHDSHVQRATGSMQVVTSFGRDFPYFAIDKDDRLVDRGTFRTGQPVRSLVYRALNKSRVVRYALSHWGDWPRSASAEDYRTTAAIVAESKAAFLERFPGGRFVVVLYPGASGSIRPPLSARGLEVLDFANLFDPHTPGLSFPIDGHPTPFANAKLAAAIVEALGL